MSFPNPPWDLSSDKSVSISESSVGELVLIRIHFKICTSRSRYVQRTTGNFAIGMSSPRLLQVGKQNATPDKGFSIQDMPVSSAILSPKDKEVIVHDGFIHCEGYVLNWKYYSAVAELATDGHTVVEDTG